MNKCVFTGRLTGEPTEALSTKGTSIAKFSIAVDRIGKDAGADFIRITTFGKSADFVNQYLGKADIVAVSGALKIDSYEKDGIKHYSTEIIAERVELIQKYKGKEKSESVGNGSLYTKDAGTIDPLDNLNEDLPW